MQVQVIFTEAKVNYKLPFPPNFELNALIIEMLESFLTEYKSYIL